MNFYIYFICFFEWPWALFPHVIAKDSMRELREEAGVDYEVVVDGIKQKRDFHSLRHFHNTAMSKGGATAEERMSQLGHSRIETNQLYTHHDVEGRRKVLEKVFGT